MKQTTIKALKVGEFFTLKPYDDTENEVPSRLVWVRGEYDKGSKTFSCYKFDDINHESFFKGSRIVYSDIYF